MRILSKLSLLAAAAIVSGSMGASVIAAAIPNAHANAEATAQTSDSSDPSSPSTGRLDLAKLKVCQKREASVDNTLSRIAQRGQNQLDLFTAIASKVETFYTSKGKTLSNYDALVADVTAKKAAAQATVNTIKADSVTFKCDGSDPKDAVATFKTALKSEIAALQAYKTSVKNLIVGVKSVQGSTTSASNSRGGQQ